MTASCLRWLTTSLVAGGVASACGAEPKAFTPWVLEDLDSAQGFSLRIPEFELAPGRESQNCYFVRVPDFAAGADLWIDRVVIAINPGSHHMNVFRVKTILGLDPAAGEPTMLGNYEATVQFGSDEYRSRKMLKLF